MRLTHLRKIKKLGKLYSILIVFMLLFYLDSCKGCKSSVRDQKSLKEGNPEESETTQLPTFQGKSFQILLVSANVHFFAEASCEKILESLDQLKTMNDDIVVLGFQESIVSRVRASLEKLKKGNFPDYKIYKSQSNDDSLENTILVYSKAYDFKIKHENAKLPYYLTSRYVNLISLIAANDFKIANTHLLGGRFDDEKWYQNINGREEQLKAIVSHQPDFIQGDFNADTNEDISELYWKNKLDLNQGETADNLKKYKINGHSYLEGKHYVKVFERASVFPTTPFKNVVDWMYYLKSNQSQKVKSIQILSKNKINCCKDIGISPGEVLSDHNFIWVRLKVELK